MLRSVFFAAAILLTVNTFAQFTVTGTVRDAQSNEILPGATVQIDSINKNTVTDEQGRFTFTDVPTGNFDVKIRFLG